MTDHDLKALPPLRTNFTNPTDVLNFIAAEQAQKKTCALIIVTGTQGGGVRAPGALAGVSETGSCAGYVSNGCVDADMFNQALEAIGTGQPRAVRYGTGSPYLDIRLPCGGAVDLIIIPNPDAKLITTLLTHLNQRKPVSIMGSMEHGLEIGMPSDTFTGWRDDKFHLHCTPKLRLRIAGRGTEPIALMRAAHALDYEVLLQSPDEDRLEAALALGCKAQRLPSAAHPPDIYDDAHTAFVMMFHDHDWETELLKQALESDAFYIGALGGRTTHNNRCQALKDSGCSQAQIKRIYGPIGLISSLRNASSLAISVLAEIIDVYENKTVS